MPDLEWIVDLDAEQACATVVERHALLVRAEAEKFYLAAHWADLHPGEEIEDRHRRSGRRALPGMERSVRLGSDGTPEVAEFAAMELGVLQGMGHAAASHYMRDALNVRERHPLLWAAIGEGEARVWQARKIAQACVALDASEARWVDAVTTRYVGSLPWGRLESLVEAKIIEVDPEAAEQRRLAAAMARFVLTGQSNEFGLKTVVARANAGDVIFFVAMVDRIAEVLRLQGDVDPVDVRRSKALGVIANPTRALQLLASAADLSVEPGTEPTDSDVERTGAAPDGCSGAAADAEDLWEELSEEVSEEVSESDVHPSQNDADDPTDEGEPELPAWRVTVDPSKFLAGATLYIHLSEEALRRGTGLARMEGVGPITVEQVGDFLRHTNVRVVPVVDLAGQTPVDGYEAPASMREALHLRGPACASPWSSHVSRRKDADHVLPYVSPDDGGPPGQTCLENLAWLARFPHRVKTFGRWRLRQPVPGVFEWRSPHGYVVRVDHAGSHFLGRTATRTRGSFLPLYKSDLVLDLSGWRHAS